MPLIDKVPYRASPYQMLYARCPDCTNFLHWLHFQPSRFVANCCGYVFDAVHDPERSPLVFWIDAQVANEKNVTYLHGRR